MKEKNELEIVSKLKESEELINSILDSSHDGIMVLNAKAKIIYAGKSVKDITGLDPDRLIGKKLEYLIERGVIYKESVSLRALNTGRRRTALLNRGDKKILTTATPYFGFNGVLKYVICNVRNITELEALRHELEEIYIDEESDKGKIYYLRLNEKLRASGLTECIMESRQMTALIELLFSLKEFDISYLITGETGTGKGLIAKVIHRIGKRREMPFVEINCSAIPSHLLESELFGYKSGAFTGAGKTGKKGLFEIANGGIIFLDEIGSMPLETQAKILKFLDDKRVTPLGGSRSIKLDVQVVSATNADLSAGVQEGSFRKDLFFRLKEVALEIPPLSKRREDVEYMIDYFWDKYNKDYNKVLMLNALTRSLLLAYSYPGNVRELKNIMRNIIITTEGSTIEEAKLPKEILEGNKKIAQEPLTHLSPISNFRESINEYEKDIIERLYQEHESTYKAAKKLGVSQSTFYRKAKKYGIIR